MNESNTLWLALLTLYLLAQALVGLVKMLRNKKANGNPGYGERIAALEKGAENNEKDHKLIRNDIEKLFDLINGMKK